MKNNNEIKFINCYIEFSNNEDKKIAIKKIEELGYKKVLGNNNSEDGNIIKATDNGNYWVAISESLMPWYIEIMI